MMHSSKKNTSSTSWSSNWLNKKMRQASATLPWSSSLGGTTLRSIPAILIWLRCTVETCSYGIYRHAKRRWKNGARPLPLGTLPPSAAASTARNGKSYPRQPATRETEEKSNSAMQKRQRSKKTWSPRNRTQDHNINTDYTNQSIGEGFLLGSYSTPYLIRANMED